MAGQLCRRAIEREAAISDDQHPIAEVHDIFDQVLAYVEGKPVHMVNPEVWAARERG